MSDKSASPDNSIEDVPSIQNQSGILQESKKGASDVGQLGLQYQQSSQDDH